MLKIETITISNRFTQGSFMNVGEAEILIIGNVTNKVKNLFTEHLKALRSKGFAKVNIHIFTSEPLKYLEELRDPILENMIISIRLYEHDINELGVWINQLTRGDRTVILIIDEEGLREDVMSVVSYIKRLEELGGGT